MSEADDDGDRLYEEVFHYHKDFVCKYCDAKVYWKQSSFGNWMIFSDPDCSIRHWCDEWKPKSKGKIAVEKEAKEQKRKEWAK